MSAPKVTVTSARTAVSCHLAGGGVDAAGHVDGDDQGVRGQLPDHVGGWSAQPAATADADHAVDHQVGRPDLVDDPAAGPAQRGEPGLVHPVGEQQRLDPRPATGQQGTGVQRVTAVVAGADQQQHAGAVDAVEQAGADPGQAGRGARHQRARRQLGQQRLLGSSDGGRVVGGAHGSALRDHDGRGDAGVVAERQVRVRARRAARPGRRPCRAG